MKARGGSASGTCKFCGIPPSLFLIIILIVILIVLWFPGGFGLRPRFCEGHRRMMIRIKIKIKIKI